MEIKRAPKFTTILIEFKGGDKYEVTRRTATETTKHYLDSSNPFIKIMRRTMSVTHSCMVRLNTPEEADNPVAISFHKQFTGEDSAPGIYYAVSKDIYCYSLTAYRDAVVRYRLNTAVPGCICPFMVMAFYGL